MNVFHRFTRRSLSKNPTRTIVTIIGIILSMAMFTAVTEASYSGLRFLQKIEIERAGAFHGSFNGIDEKVIEATAACDKIKDYAYFREVGIAYAETGSDSKPFIKLLSISDNFTDMVAVKLTDGRMPKSESEIILPDDMMYGDDCTVKLGDTVSLNVGSLEYNSETDEDEIVNANNASYTVVGIYKGFDSTVDDYYSSYFPALTVGNESGFVRVFFTVKNPAGYYKFVENQTISSDYSSHRDLLRFCGVFGQGSVASVMYGFEAILMLLIAFGSISLIYNSFSISVSERTKQFGILKSVGATKKQIMSSVLYEALLLSGIGIPIGMISGCAGIGLTFYFLKDAFSSFLNSDSTVTMCLEISPVALIIAAIVCLITALISAYIPARKAMKVSAIEAIRQTNDTKISAKEVKTSPLTAKLFGFEGMMASKNFKRNRKRYRSTVISLFLSVTLFISASSFCSYLTDTVEDVTTPDSGADITYYAVGEDKDVEKVFSLLCGNEYVTEGAYYEEANEDFYVDDSLMTNAFSEFSERENTKAVPGQLIFVNDKAFNSICRENGLDSEKYYDAAHPISLVANNCKGNVYYMDGTTKFYSFDILNGSAAGSNIKMYKIKHFDGYIWYDVKTDEDGSETYIYYPSDYYTEYTMGDFELDESRAMVLSKSVATYERSFEVGAVMDEVPFPLYNGVFAVIYPYSMKEAVLGEDTLSFGYQTSYSFTTSNHSSAYAAMKESLEENGMGTDRIYDIAEDSEKQRTLVTVINVFAYGFIALISLISVANVFNTISTNVSLRRREFAMLKSIGLSQRGLNKMANYECIIYGIKALLYGLPASVLVTYGIYRVTGIGIETAFYIPVHSIIIAIFSVFIVVFSTMLYSMSKIKNDNTIDALKNENL